jgi:hypothetical protein
MSNTPKWILEACADPKRNPHNLKASTVSSRYYRQKQTLEKALSYPLHTKQSAARLGGKKSSWGQWSPGKFSRRDKLNRGNEPEWRIKNESP